MQHFIVPNPDEFADGVPLKGVRSEHLADRLILPAHLAASAFGGSGVITEIDPDDTATAGATGLIADAGHQHPWTCVAPASLTRTASNTEGTSGDGARADHGHATDVLAWGLLGTPTTLTANSSATSGTTELDLALDQTRTVDTGRRVRLTFSYFALLGTVANDFFEIRFKENTVQVAAFQTQMVGAAAEGKSLVHTYTPTAGSRTFEVFLVRTAGTGTGTVVASSTRVATFTVEDAGT